MPTSSSAVCQQSITDPTIGISPAAGISSTIGPASAVLKNGIKYKVSVFGVSVWLCQLHSPDQNTIWFARPPAAQNAWNMAS